MMKKQFETLKIELLLITEDVVTLSDENELPLVPFSQD